MLFDRIVVLEDGAIVEDGTHAELSRAGGVYESLWDRQTGAFLEAEYSAARQRLCPSSSACRGPAPTTSRRRQPKKPPLSS